MEENEKSLLEQVQDTQRRLGVVTDTLDRLTAAQRDLRHEVAEVRAAVSSVKAEVAERPVLEPTGWNHPLARAAGGVAVALVAVAAGVAGFRIIRGLGFRAAYAAEGESSRNERLAWHSVANPPPAPNMFFVQDSAAVPHEARVTATPPTAVN